MMYLIGGATKKTCAATLGTLAGVVLAGISAWCFSKASGISGYNVSDIETLMTFWNTNRIQVGGLLFSGLLISCLGAVMDVAMSISSAIDEIYKQNSSLTKKELFKAGMRVGSFGIVLSVPLTVLICISRFRASTLAQAMCGVMISFLLSLRPEIQSSC